MSRFRLYELEEHKCHVIKKSPIPRQEFSVSLAARTVSEFIECLAVHIAKPSNKVQAFLYMYCAHKDFHSLKKVGFYTGIIEKIMQ